VAPVAQTGPAQRLALGGAALELVMTETMTRNAGLVSETFGQDRAGALMRAAKIATIAGAVGATVFGRRSRWGSAVSGAALLAGSALTRFGIFEAGRASTLDPKYVVLPQRERMEAGDRTPAHAAG
ncbi:MAG: polysulfide reductase, partial [Allobranchiibius sp.]